MNLRRRCILPFILASLGLIAIPPMMPAQVTSGEQNAHSDAPSKADAASLQKKATEAQARIHANKDDRDQMMMAVKTNEVAAGQTSPPQKRIHR